ncbi:STAS domain-containing protein [Amycolatopsis cynarae]|uniref:STAS domain-containing protein n=1 Tax=Amycolatopsis cynarae TaxID=2995223 RepID=A0ABY7BAF7_9PSEU|nr:STAS domain-containing protein [Amycolatopsis sp. HUAS 11-8]WAL69141.1 STAS domain-containing protein [Amycolatopsis sp. HUAS 11-8]
MTAAEPFSHPLTEFAFPRPRTATEARPEVVSPPMRVRVRRPRPGLAIVVIGGEVDRLSAPRLEELLTSRLRGTLRALVVDLSGVDFLGTAGLSALVRADLLARQRGISLRILSGDNRGVVRALRLTDLPLSGGKGTKVPTKANTAHLSHR